MSQAGHKQPYHRPQLTMHGTITDLTRTSTTLAPTGDIPSGGTTYIS